MHRASSVDRASLLIATKYYAAGSSTESELQQSSKRERERAIGCELERKREKEIAIGRDNGDDGSFLYSFSLIYLLSLSFSPLTPPLSLVLTR